MWPRGRTDCGQSATASDQHRLPERECFDNPDWKIGLLPSIGRLSTLLYPPFQEFTRPTRMGGSFRERMFAIANCGAFAIRNWSASLHFVNGGLTNATCCRPRNAAVLALLCWRCAEPISSLSLFTLQDCKLVKETDRRRGQSARPHVPMVIRNWPRLRSRARR